MKEKIEATIEEGDVAVPCSPEKQHDERDMDVTLKKSVEKKIKDTIGEQGDEGTVQCSAEKKDMPGSREDAEIKALVKVESDGAKKCRKRHNDRDGHVTVKRLVEKQYDEREREGCWRPSKKKAIMLLQCSTLSRINMLRVMSTSHTVI